MSFDINYLGHQFILNQDEATDPLGENEFKCTKCKVIAYQKLNGGKYNYWAGWKNNGPQPVALFWQELTLTCDEFIIKNIIE
jgi:hypothetical protein